MGHCNIGQAGNTLDVDKWHFDSVDYVLVMILSDMTDMEGGELQVLRQCLGGEEGMQVLENGVPQEHVSTVSYQSMGWGIFCQGSKILHRVSPVLRALEPRISMVMSLQAADVFAESNTRTLKVFGDPEHIVNWEMCRHSAWLARRQLSYLLDHANADTDDPFEIAARLSTVAKNLSKASRIITGAEDDAIKFIEQDAGFEGSPGRSPTALQLEITGGRGQALKSRL